MSNWHETNAALAKLFNLPRLTQRAVIVLRGDGPPMLRVTRLMIEQDDVRQITERFELRKVGSGETAKEWICPRCKADRLKEDCKGERMNCPMAGVAHNAKVSGAGTASAGLPG